MNFTHEGCASTVKWTAPDPCLVFSESDSNLYPSFGFCEETNHKQFKNTLIYKAKQVMTTKKTKKSLHILQDGTRGVEVSDIKQLIV